MQIAKHMMQHGVSLSRSVRRRVRCFGNPWLEILLARFPALPSVCLVLLEAMQPHAQQLLQFGGDGGVHVAEVV